MTLALGATLAVGSATGVSTPAAAEQGEPWQAAREESVPGTGVTVPEPEPDPAEELALRSTPAVSWPKPGAADVKLGARFAAAKAGTLPVQVGPAKTAGAADAGGTPAGVNVRLVERHADGLLLRVARTDGVAAEGKVSLRVDYSAFRNAYGGDWAVRLRLVALPECALSTPDKEDCRGTPLPTTNNGSGVLTADVAVPAAEKDGTGGSALYAMMADASSGAGDYQASSLSPSATWSVGSSAGDFGWSYPMEVPPALDGPEPQLTLGYSSGSVDGRTSSTNNQPSWIGDGFDFTPGGYIERRYKSCGLDRGKVNNQDPNNKDRKTGDMCWGTDNATFSLNGRGGELIRDDVTGEWKPKVDDGSKVERLTLPADKSNGDLDKEYWRITTQDGTKFYFGLHQLPSTTASSTVTNSVWTLPVFGNHPGEPCHTSTFPTSHCPQAWRWNLDYVVDPHDNTMSFFYKKETNNYARNQTASTVSNYVRGGWLAQIDYGQRDGQALTALPVGRVVFTEKDRCIEGTTCTTSQPLNWPDVPWDQACTSTTSCPNKFTPTFFTQKRLARITTQVRRGSTMDDVDTWEFKHTYPDPGDGPRPALWLNSISHTGKVGPTDVSLPDVNFDSVQMDNRVDGVGTDMIPPMKRMRIKKIRLDSGGQVVIDYSEKECSPTNLPVPDSNTKRCHPMRWTPDGELNERTDWFNKYVVTRVTESDVTTGGPAEVTQVEYPSLPAWHHDEQDGLVPEEKKTWGQWRGYDKVVTRKGTQGSTQTVTQATFFRGMDGDRTAAGTLKDVWITDSADGRKEDLDALAGTERERITYTNGSTMRERSITDPWLSPATATRTRSWGTTVAQHMQEASVRQAELIPGGGLQNSGSDNVYNDDGVLLRSTDFGNMADPNDDTCTRYTYTSNDSVGLAELPARVETVATSCDRTASYPDDLLADERIYYDNATSVTAPPTKGDITRKEEFNGWVNGAPRYVTTEQTRYDAYGREIETIDVKGGRTKVVYSPADGPVTRKDVTDPVDHTAYTLLEPAWGEELLESDADGRRTEYAYDGLGRLTKVWLPGRNAATQSPNTEYSYLVRADGPAVVTSKELQPDGTYLTEYEIFDGQLRPRQTQVPAPGGGRVVTDTVYDSRGLEVGHNGPYYNEAPPGPEVLIPSNVNDLPAQEITEYDDNERPTLEIFKVRGAEKWRTTHSYAPNRHDIDPPPGQTPTTRITDDDGQVVELRQYQGDSPTGAYDATRYTYTKKGQLETVTDPAGNVWRNHYDSQGRLDHSEDPDRGATDYTYNDADEVVTQKDARGITLVYEYDLLGRKKVVREGSSTGPKLAEWGYDTAADGTTARGAQTSSTRWVGNNPYKISVSGYDAAGRPKGTTYSIPDSEGRLAGEYTVTNTYKQDGDIATIGLPGVGGLPQETLTIGYDPGGLPKTLSGATPYVADTTYSPFGEMSGMTLSTGGKWVNFGYDYETGTRRLSRAVVQRENAPQKLADISYTYDESGNVRRIADTPDPATGLAADTQCFRYDYLRRLTNAWTPTSGDCAANPTAAGLGGAAPYWHQWEFDKTGNRKKETRTEPSGATTTRTYNYPAPGTPQPHTLRSVTTTGPSGTRTDPFGYDATGNTTSRKHNAADETLTWDKEGHLASVTGGDKTTAFVYDADGNRLIRRDSSGTTLFIGNTEVLLSTNGVLSGTRYYDHAGRVVAVRTSADGKLNWLGLDHHGTPEIAIDSGTQQVNRRRFTPYGEVRGAAPEYWPGQKSFVGGTADPSTGLIHLGAREYDPALGRFLSVDPVIDYQDPQQTNGYAYANNSPATFTDPDGRFGFSSLVKVAQSVVHTVTKRVVQPVKSLVPYTVTTWNWVKVHGSWTAIKSYAHKVKEVTKHIARKVTQRVKKVVHKVKRIYHKIKRKVTQSKAWKWAKRAAKAVGKAAKRAWKATKSAAKRAAKAVGRAAKKLATTKSGRFGALVAVGSALMSLKMGFHQLKPGGSLWQAAKLGLGLAAVFGCVICGGAAAIMGAVDMYRAAQDGDGTGVAFEAVGVLSFGAGSVISKGLSSARALAKTTVPAQKSLRASVDAASRVPKWEQAAKVHQHADYGIWAASAARDTVGSMPG